MEDITLDDYILRATAGEGSVRAFVATTRNTVNEACDIHKTSPVVSAALGRLLSAAAIMGLTLKDDGDLLTINVKGDGQLSGLTVTANNKAMVKGYPYVQNVEIPLKENGKLDVSGALGYGTLTVIKDMGMKEPYVGQIPLVSGEIGEDLTYYFAKSEQTPSAIAVGVLVDIDYSIKQSGAFFIQMMPSANENIAEALEEKLKTFPPLTTLLEEGKTPEDILEMLLGEFGVKINDKVPVSYHCNCERAKVEKALISVGLDELKLILEEDKSANLHCHFCNKNYSFDENDLKKIIESVQSK